MKRKMVTLLKKRNSSNIIVWIGQKYRKFSKKVQKKGNFRDNGRNVLKIPKIGKYYGAKLGGKSRFFSRDQNCTTLFLYFFEKMSQFSLDWF